MSSEALRLLDEELAIVEREHHDTTMLLAHQHIEGMGAIDAKEFQKYCRSQNHKISLYDAEAALQFYANTLTGESHD